MQPLTQKTRLALSALALLTVCVAARPPAALADPVAPQVQYVRVLSLPGTLDAQGVRELATELRLAGPSTKVLLRVPASVQIADGALQALRDAAGIEKLDVAVELGQGSESGNPADAVLSVAKAVYVVGDTSPGVDQGGAIRVPDDAALVARLQQDLANPQLELLDGSVGDQTLDPSSAPAAPTVVDPEPTTAPPPERGRGISRWLIPAAVALLALALTLLVLSGRGGRRRERVARPERRPPPVPETRPAPTSPHTPARRRPAGRRPAPDHGLPSSGRAIVRSELHPDGYVELAGCLRRARWSVPGAAPPAIGELVRVEAQGGRLVALPKEMLR